MIMSIIKASKNAIITRNDITGTLFTEIPILIIKKWLMMTDIDY